MAKGNSVKGGGGGGGGGGASKKGGGKVKNVKRRGKPEKGAKGEPGNQSYGKGAGVPGGKPKKKKGARHKQLPGVAPDPTEGDDSDVDESLGEGLEEYAGYSNFLLDMDASKLKEPTKAEPAPDQVSRREKKKRKAEERDAGPAGGMDKGSDEDASDGENDEADYESRPRKAQKWGEKKAEALPVRGADGKWTIPDRPKPEPAPSGGGGGGSSDGSDGSEDELEDEMDDEAAEQAAAEHEKRVREARKVAADPRLAAVARYQTRQQGIADAREAIAKTCAAIVENPEESGHRILALHEYYPDGDPDATEERKTLEDCSAVKKMLLLSQLAVFKDIVPGYKIRALSEQEQDLKVSKEVRAQRDYENMLLSMYQRYLQRLHAVVSVLNKQNSTPSQISLGLVAAKCLADLLQSLHHFNYSNNIVATLIPMLDSPREEVVQVSSAAINQLFKRETYSAAVVTAVRAIDQYAQKRKYRMRSGMLECLLELRLTEDADEKLRKLKDQQKKERKEKNKKNKGTVAHQSDAELERDMAESSAVMDTQSRRLAQAAMLRAMFLSYFRVLKSPRRLGPGVLTATLAGLGHFSHLISIDFLGDLFTCLNTLLRQGGVLPASVEEDLPPPPAFEDEDEDMDGEEDFKLSVTDALTACHAAMTLLSGERGETLEIDPQTTCTALYFLLPRLCVAEFDYLIPKALDSLRLILLQRRQLSMPRVGAFLKALISLAASTPMPHSAIAIIAFSRQLLLRYPKIRRLLESVDEGQQTMGGVVGLGLGPRGYRMDVEPDHANALESTAWELTVLVKHWHPSVRDASQGLLAENGGAGRLSQVLASAPGTGGVHQLWNTYNVSESGGFIPSFPPAPRGKIAPSWQVARNRDPLLTADLKTDEPLLSEEAAEPPQFSGKASGLCWDKVGGGASASSRKRGMAAMAMANAVRDYRSFIAQTELMVSSDGRAPPMMTSS